VSPEVMHMAVMQLEQPEEKPICCTSESNSDPGPAPPDDPHAERTTAIAHTLELASLTMIARILMIPAFPSWKSGLQGRLVNHDAQAPETYSVPFRARKRDRALALFLRRRPTRVSTARVRQRKNLPEREET
jgi:hypothetical protein